MWKLSVNGLREIVKDSEYPVSWEPVVCKGTVPNNISHHKSAVFGNSVVIFGGINDYENNKEEIKEKVKEYKQTNKYNPSPEQKKKWARTAYLKKKEKLEKEKIETQNI
jgi:hypothetical protein